MCAFQSFKPEVNFPNRACVCCPPSPGPARHDMQFIYKSTAGGHQHVHVMDPARPEIQEGFMRAGAEMDGWKYVWRVSVYT